MKNIGAYRRRPDTFKLVKVQTKEKDEGIRKFIIQEKIGPHRGSRFSYNIYYIGRGGVLGQGKGSG